MREKGYSLRRSNSMTWLRFIFKEIKNSRRFCLLFIFNLSMGLTGFIALEGFKNGIELTLKSKSKSILGADFGLSSRRPITDDEKKVVTNLVKNKISESNMIEIFSMVSNFKSESRLLQIKAIEKNYPFYGKIALQNNKQIGPALLTKSEQESLAYVYPEVLLQLKVKIGDKIKIGVTEFKIEDVVTHDSADGISTQMAPRIYISLNQLNNTELLKPGTLAWHSVVYQWDGSTHDQLEKLRDEAYKAINDPDIQVYSHENISDQMGRLLGYLNDFLGLCSLIALFMSAVGAGFLFRSYFKNKMKDLAILISLGCTRSKAFVIYSGQLLFLGLFSALISLLASTLIIAILSILTKNLLPFELHFGVSSFSIMVALGIGTLGSFLVGFPIFLNSLNFKPSQLLFENYQTKSRFTIFNFLSLIPGAIAFYFLSVVLSHSLKIGSLFSVLFFAGLLIFLFFAWLTFKVLAKYSNPYSINIKWTIRDLIKNKATSYIAFLAIALSVLLLNIIPQVKLSLNNEFQKPESSKAPSLFLFDIQEDQLDDLKTIIQSSNQSISQLSPTIRARLVSINGIEFDKGSGMKQGLNREQEQEMRFRNRGVNLSFRSQILDSETIVEGKAFTGSFVDGINKIPEISIEKRFADRLKIKLNDVIEFDIESIPVKGQVTSFRSVKWSSFQPNFFIQFQPGVLETAPKTFLMSLPQMSIEQKNSLQNQIVNKLPNVSMVDVSRVVEKLSSIIDQMALALQSMSVLCIFIGFIVIFSLSSHQADQRKYDIGLLKSLGAPFEKIKFQFILQFSILAFLGASIGSFLSVIIAFILNRYLFDNYIWVFDLVSPVLSILMTTLIVAIITFFATRKALSTKAVLLLTRSN